MHHSVKIINIKLKSSCSLHLYVLLVILYECFTNAVFFKLHWEKREMTFRRKFWNPFKIGDHYLIIISELTCQATVLPCIVSTISAPHRIRKIRARNSAGSVRSNCRSRQRSFRILCGQILCVIVILECKRSVNHINIKRNVWEDKRNN
jgi:hypothetical protein